MYIKLNAQIYIFLEADLTKVVIGFESFKKRF